MRTKMICAVAMTMAAIGIAARVAVAEPKGESVTVKGEVVDLWCYMEAGDTGAEHKACATACAKGGNPIGIVDADGNVYLLMGFADHQASRDMFIEKMAETVSVAGILASKGGTQTIFVQTLE